MSRTIDLAEMPLMQYLPCTILASVSPPNMGITCSHNRAADLNCKNLMFKKSLQLKVRCAENANHIFFCISIGITYLQGYRHKAIGSITSAAISSCHPIAAHGIHCSTSDALSDRLRKAKALLSCSRTRYQICMALHPSGQSTKSP